MGLVILDAMVKGKPTIVANVGNQSEIIKNEINGYLVARDNKMVENFVNNIFRLMNDNNLYERIKNNALITVKKDFDVEISVKKYLNLFEELFLD
jgi:glycosyltransferase involved in cell wall biosynthesis